MDAQQLYEYLQEATGSVVESFDQPDDDWMPVGHLVTDNDEMMVVGFEPSFLANEDGKDRMTKAIIELVEKHHAQAFALVTSSWVLRLPREAVAHPELEYGEGGIPRPATHPDREEMLCVSAITADGGVFGMAPINRSDTEPPTLGEWTQSDEATGRFVEPVLNALKIERRAKGE